MKIRILLIAIILPLYSFGQGSYPLHKEKSLLEPHLLQEDFKLLYEQLQNNHSRLFGYRTKTDADEDFQKIINNLQKPLERMDFYRVIAPFISEFQDGHTSLKIDFEDIDIINYESAGGRFFPLEVIIIENKLYCISNPHLRGNIANGDEILSINGLPVSTIIPELRRLKSSDGEANANANIQRWFGYTTWLYGLEGSEFKINYTSGQRIVEEKLSGITKEELLQLIYKAITPTTKLHLYQQSDLAVVEINSYGNVPVTKRFIDSSFKVIKNHGIKNVALDLRKNSGGNSSVGDYFLAHITKQPYSVIKRKSWRLGPLVQQLDSTHFISKAMKKVVKEYENDGDMWHSPYLEPIRANVVLKDSSLFQPLNLYLFTSARTYSSAHMTALAIKCGKLGVIIGQPTGERLNLTGETMEYTMPNSGLSVYIPVAAYETPCGNGDTVGVPPDYITPYTVQDLRKGRDPELTFLQELLKREKKDFSK